jgi:parallel beta-helix repeat protein
MMTTRPRPVVPSAILLFLVTALVLGEVVACDSPNPSEEEESAIARSKPILVQYEDYSIPVIQGHFTNYPPYHMVFRFPGATAGDQIQACIQALPPSGGTCDARGVESPLTINHGVNIFSGAKGAGILILGAGTYTVHAAQYIPSNWEVRGAGASTILQAAAATDFPNPYAVLSNSNVNTYSGDSGHNTAILVHDLTIDGNYAHQAHPLQAGIVFQGADGSEIHHVYLRSINFSGIDLRDGSNNSVHDCTATQVGMSASGQHAFGGGANTGLFQNNRFYDNRASGGPVGDMDHYDINGNQVSTAANCTGNQMTNNTSDHASSYGIFVDSCRNTLVQGNTITAPVLDGIDTSSGHQLASGNTFTGNTITNPGRSGVFLLCVAENDTVTSNTIRGAGQAGIWIQDSWGHDITNNTISDPGVYGILCNWTVQACSDNKIINNTITSTSGMSYGIEFQNLSGLHDNTVSNNHTSGGHAGSTGEGVDVPPSTPSTAVNVSTNWWTP